jgi:hypothetical protein
MIKLFVSMLAALALLSLSTVASRADEFSRIQTSSETYWVPAPTPHPVYVAVAPPPPPYYYGPPPPGYYYGPPPPRPPVVIIPRFFIGFHFH